MQFLDILTRQGHPGPTARAYKNQAAKTRDAERFKSDEAIPWPVLVDNLAGSVHQIYGTLADPAYLIDADGNVAFYSMWTSAPALHRALAELEAHDWRGVASGGVSRMPNALSPLVDGWRGLRRGLPQSTADLSRAVPLSSEMLRLGDALRPLLARLARGAQPVPAPVKGLLLGGLALPLLLRLRR